jgi:hypothetical protein
MIPVVKEFCVRRRFDNRSRIFFIVASLSLLLAGCEGTGEDASTNARNKPGDSSQSARAFEPGAATRAELAEKAVPAHLFFSPNGEPLNGGPLGWPSCGDAVRKWFARLDTNHDGTLSRAEFLADAKDKFAAMDIDHNGYLLPEELARYRLPYREDTAQLKKIPQAKDSGAEGNRNGENGEHKHKHGAETAEGFSDIAADPVMAADTNLDNRVTFTEFSDHADRAFDALATDSKEALTPKDALGLCK